MGRFFKNKTSNQTCILILKYQKNSTTNKAFRITDNLKTYQKIIRNRSNLRGVFR